VRDKALVLVLLRYPQELVDVGEYEIPTGNAAAHRVTKREVEMARQLIDAMSSKWNPKDYKDEFRERLHKAIAKRMKSKGVVTPAVEEEPEETTTNVVDFMDLLRKSLASNKRTPAKKSAPAKKTRRTKSAAKRPRKARKSA